MQSMKQILIKSITMMLALAIVVVDIPVAQAQSFEQGYQSFLNGDYRRARGLLNRGLRQTRDRYDRALIYKLLGITEYKLGSRSRAAGNFKKALKLDPAIKINREETKDRRVLQLFSQVKQSMRGGSRSSMRRRGSRSRRSMRSMSPRSMAMRSSNTTADTSGNLIINLLPFGLGQFQQGKTFLGAGLAVGQVIGLGLFFERSQAEAQANQDALDVINDYEQNGADSGIDETQFLQYLDENEQFVLKARQEATLGLILFGGLYAGGVLEALLNPPAPPMRSPGRRPMRRRGSLELNHQQLGISLKPGEVLESLYTSPIPYQKPRPVAFDVTRYQGRAAGLVRFHLGTF